MARHQTTTAVRKEEKGEENEPLQTRARGLSAEERGETPEGSEQKLLEPAAKQPGGVGRGERRGRIENKRGRKIYTMGVRVHGNSVKPRQPPPPPPD